jgi:hypothetical protein
MPSRHKIRKEMYPFKRDGYGVMGAWYLRIGGMGRAPYVPPQALELSMSSIEVATVFFIF